MTEPDAATRRAALVSLLHAMPPEQQTRAAGFLLQEVERLYVAAGIPRPVWIDELRSDMRRGECGSDQIR